MKKHVLLLAFLCTYAVASQDSEINQAEPPFKIQTENGNIDLCENLEKYILSFLSVQEIRELGKTCKKNNQIIKVIRLERFCKGCKKIVAHLEKHDFNAPLSGEGYASDYKKDRRFLFQEFADYDPPLFLFFFEKYPTSIFVRDWDKKSLMSSIFKRGMSIKKLRFLERFLNIAEKNKKKILAGQISDISDTCMPTELYDVALDNHLLKSMINFIRKYEKKQEIVDCWHHNLLSFYEKELASKSRMLYSNFQNMMIEIRLVEISGKIGSIAIFKHHQETMQTLHSEIKKLVQSAEVLLENIQINGNCEYIKECEEGLIGALEAVSLLELKVIKKTQALKLERLRISERRQALFKKVTISTTCLAGLWIVAKNMLSAS